MIRATVNQVTARMHIPMEGVTDAEAQFMMEEWAGQLSDPSFELDGEAWFELISDMRWEKGGLVFVDDVAESEDFHDALDAANLPWSVDDRINDTVTEFLVAVSREAFVKGYEIGNRKRPHTMRGKRSKTQ